MSKEDVWVAEVFAALSSFLFFVTLAAMRRMRRRPMTERVRTLCTASLMGSSAGNVGWVVGLLGIADVAVQGSHEADQKRAGVM